ncbi:Box C/D snoRNA protein 1 [Trichoderma ghanense]|uniref:Box C/D snoRNA protein 1 n=1 Tax=Trichoderma ghanense TaxID=65468 RepID=A0ABY2H9Z0_9HYPO
MADAVLTSLCGICHINTPKYKCPRCSIATCSLACVTKHKSWSQCSGARDQTAYVAKSRLATPAGIDHDYNFLHSIEMASERAERVFVEDKGIIQKDELRPLTVEEVRWKVGRDGRRRKVLVTRVLKQNRDRLMDKMLASKLKKQGTVVVSAPQGMTRHRENHTTVSRRPGKVNWQVEWFTFERSSTDADEMHTSRALSKLLDDVPLYKGYNALLASQAKAEGKVQRRPFKSVAQTSPDAHWHMAVDTLQDPQTGRWFSTTAPSIDEWPRAKDEAQRRQFQFFLESTRKRPDRRVTLTSVPSEGCLRDILRNTRVLEFPTIYVLREGEALPAGYVLGPKDVVSPVEEQQRNGKRKVGPEQGKDNNRLAKRKRRGDEDGMEEGELGDDADPDDDHSKTVDGAEADEVVAEQSLDEDEDDDTSDDETSSSGSDSD